VHELNCFWQNWTRRCVRSV